MRIRDQFSELSKQQLIDAFKAVGLKGYSKLTKAALAERLEEYVLSEEFMTAKLVFLSDNEYGIINDIITGDKTHTASEVMSVESFLTSGYIGVDDKGNLILNDGVEELLNKCLTDNVKQTRSLYGVIRMYCNAFVRLYGIIPIQKAHSIYADQNVNHLPLDAFVKTVDAIAAVTDEFKIYNACIVNNIYISFDDSGEIKEEQPEFNSLLLKQDGCAYFIPDRESLIKFGDSLYFEHTESYTNLAEYLIWLMERTENNKDMAMPVLEALYTAMESAQTLNEVITVPEISYIELQNPEEANKLITLIKALDKDVRKHIYRGFSANILSNYVSAEKNARKREFFESKRNSSRKSVSLARKKRNKKKKKK